jgi:membrane protease subunit HflC
MRTAFATLMVILGVTIAGVYASAFIVHQNEQALVLRFGAQQHVIEEPGLYWRAPLIDTVDYFDKRILDIDMPVQQVTASDQKRLMVDAFARYRINDPLRYYQRVRTERDLRRQLGAIVESTMGQVLGGATFSEVVRDKRDDLMTEIHKRVHDSAKGLGIEVIDVRIKRADLPEANYKSVFERMRAERKKDAEEFRAQGQREANRIQALADRKATVIRAEAQRDADLKKGEGDGERSRIFAEAYSRNPEFFAFYRSMLAYEQSLSSKDTRFVISPDSEKFKDFFRYLSEPPSATPAAPKR